MDLSAEERSEIDGTLVWMKGRDHYQLLGVQQDADASAIKTAYYDLTRKWHPDRFARKQLGDYESKLDHIFGAFTEAYQVLKDATRRGSYNAELRRRRRQEQAPVIAREEVTPTGGTPSTAGRASASVASQEPRRRRRRSSSVRSRGLDRVQQQIVERLRQGRRHYKEGQAFYEAGELRRASASLALARSYDPENDDYVELTTKVQAEVHQMQAQQYVAAAENAETYRNIREAIANYQKAIDYGTRDGRAYHRLGMLTWRYQDDLRGGLALLRKAVQLAPSQVDFHIDLGDAYAALDLGLNARREYQAALKLDKSSERAREGLKGLR